MPIVICANCGNEKNHHAKGLCHACYMAKYREVEDPYGSAFQIKKARKIVRKLGTRILMDVEELLDKGAPYFATKEELLALTSTINRIRQREINSTDADILKAQREFLQDAETEIGRASAEAKVNSKKTDKAIVLLDEPKPN